MVCTYKLSWGILRNKFERGVRRILKVPLIWKFLLDPQTEENLFSATVGVHMPYVLSLPFVFMKWYKIVWMGKTIW